MKTNDLMNLYCNDFDELICKDIIFPKTSIITKMINNNELTSLLFYGNPGVGKSIAISFILKKLNKEFNYFNATTGNKNDLTSILEKSKDKQIPIIVIEEIHRLNKDKQDLLLYYLEKKMIIVLATTTENPFFKVNPAIRSRLLLYHIESIDPKILKIHLKTYLKNKKINLSEKIIDLIVSISKSDFRQIFFYIELILKYYSNETETTILKEFSKITNTLIDIKGTNHYDILSAFHKSIRGSDPDAAIYYLSQLLTTGDLTAIYRRLYAVAYEDIGLANSTLAAKVADAIKASETLGLPEARLPLAAITIELCLSPKSNSAVVAIDAAINELSKANYPPPLHLRDNHYESAIKLGVKGYKYPHDYDYNYVNQQYLPKEISNIKFYKVNKFSISEVKYSQYWTKIKSKN